MRFGRSFLLPILAVLALGLCGCQENPSSDITSSDPALGVSDLSLDFGLSGLLQSLAIYNAGGGTLSWSLSAEPDWVEPSDTSGALAANDSAVVDVQINRSLLATGLNVDSLYLESNGGSLWITVQAELAGGPFLAVLPDTLDFASLDDSLQLTIYNTGQGLLTWSISMDDPWFTAAPDTGSTMTSSTVWVRLDRETAPDGQQQSYLHISSNGGDAQVKLLAFVGNQQGQWLSYCGQADGYYPAWFNDYFFIVRFDRPPDWQDFKVSRVRIQLHTLSGAYDTIQLLCWNVVVDNGYIFPDIYGGVLYQSGDLNPVQGWDEWEVDWPLNLSTFCVGYYQADYTGDIFPDPYYDSSYSALRSYIVWEQYFNYFVIDLLYTWEWCIEVFVEPIYVADGAPVAQGLWLKPASIEPAEVGSNPRPKHKARHVVEFKGE